MTIAIIGAGIAGASLAFRLAERGADVLLLERESQPGYHSTGRSAAMFMESYGPPGVRALTRASRAAYEDPPGALGIDVARTPIVSPRGALYVAMHGQEAQLDAFEHELRATSADASAIRRLDTTATLALAPCLRADLVAGALYEDDAMDLDVHTLHHGYLRGARAHGAVLRCDAEVVAAQRTGRAWRLALRDGSGVEAETVVLAAGAWCDELGTRCFGAQPIGLRPKRRSAFTFDAPTGIDIARWPTIAAIDESWYFKPDAGRLLGSPANAADTVPHDVRPEDLDIAIAIDRLEAATTLHIARPASTWAGLRSFVADGEMVIGVDRDVEGLFWLAGQGGYGIQSADGAAQLAAALLMQAPMPSTLTREDVTPDVFAPSRPSRSRGA